MGVKTAAPFTAKAVDAINEPGLYPDGGCVGLYLQATISKRPGTDGEPVLAKSWIYRFRWGTKVRHMGLGTYPEPTGLAKARKKAADARQAVHDNVDPIAARDAERAAARKATRVTPTFKALAETFIRTKQHEWSNDKHAAQWSSTLETYAFPMFGSVSVDQVDKRHILDCLQQPVKDRAGKVVPGSTLWTARTETATRLRQRIENVLDYGKAAGHRSGDNPAAWSGNLEAMLPKPGKVKKVEHHAELDFREIAPFMAELAKRTGPAARALELTILTACRTSEVLEAEWSEFDLDGSVWNIPAARMKMRRPHRVPLSESAVKVLRDLDHIEGEALVFPGQRAGKPLSNMAMLMLLDRMGLKGQVTTHGFRATFKTWANETTSFPNEVIEMALAHLVGNAVEQAYMRGDLFEKRRMLMDAWAAHCATLPETGNVTSLSAKRKRA